jgi:hypothetical protein
MVRARTYRHHDTLCIILNILLLVITSCGHLSGASVRMAGNVLRNSASSRGLAFYSRVRQNKLNFISYVSQPSTPCLNQSATHGRANTCSTRADAWKVAQSAGTTSQLFRAQCHPGLIHTSMRILPLFMPHWTLQQLTICPHNLQWRRGESTGHSVNEVFETACPRKHAPTSCVCRSRA